MLVLSRKLGERIHIGDDIVVVVTDIRAGKIRLGIDAPRSVVVQREELLRGRTAPSRPALVVPDRIIARGRRANAAGK